MMMKKIIISLMLGLIGSVLHAQVTSSCDKTVAEVTHVLKRNSPFKNFTQLFKSLKPCADNGNVQAQNYIGLLYIEGLGVPKDESLGFQYIKKAAISGFGIAQGNLGRLYKNGIGCNINPTKAAAWFAKGTANGNSKAAYSLGYMYYKGLGVSQNYQKAIECFKKSEDPMAKHWLGVAYYFGYGVPQNTDTAVGYLTANGTLNSKNFLAHIQAEKKKQEEAKVAQEIQKTVGEKKIEAKVLEHAPEIIADNQTLKNKDLVGAWIGKWIEYDESGTIIQRILPIALNFTLDEIGDIKTELNFNGQTIKDYVLFEDNNLFIDNFIFSLKKQYTHNANEPDLTYQVLGMDFSKQIYNSTQYLLADMDAYIPIWEETASPMSLVLRPKGDKVVDKEEEEVLLALAEQKDEFIKLYPVPFTNQLHIGFYLEEATSVQIKLTGVQNGQTEIIEQGKNLQQGNQTYHANVSHLQTGLYIVKVITKGKAYTRIVVKN